MKVVDLSPQWIYRKWEKAATLYNDTESMNVAEFTDRNPIACSASIDELFPTETVKFEWLEVQNAPGYDAMLTRMYGNYMELPPVEDRKNHVPSKLDFGSY